MSSLIFRPVSSRNNSTLSEILCGGIRIHGESAPPVSPHFSLEREVRERRCLKIQGFDESSAERRERDKTRKSTLLYVEPFVRTHAVYSGLPHIALAKWGRCTPAVVGW